ncbi:MAG: single-stranded-DNA-specific exonuclease RecJ [Chloroflexia bacterium]
MEARPSRWEIHPEPDPLQAKQIQASLPHLQLTPLMVRVLANRGVSEPEDIEAFVKPPDLASYPDPLRLNGMGEAVARIERAIRDGERIVVYGDFDADGVTSTSLLTLALRHFGAHADPYIPNRAAEGYGLNAMAVAEIARRGAKLLITVDCGISGRHEVAEASRAGLDVIVTDHHSLPDDLPEASACINPKQATPGCECYHDLAGVGVAYQLVRALVKRLGKPPSLRNLDLLGLVAIGTVADVVPLKGANRSLVAQGIAAIPQHSMPGLRTLLKFAHLDVASVDAERIGFVVGPRLNAAGRVDDASTAYRLLMTDSESEAQALAQKLEAQNRRRQAIMNSVVEQARDRARRLGDDTKVILLHDAGWPSGVVGLVAGRLAEEFGRPTLVLEEGQEESRGSARSGRNFNMVQALAELKDMLIKYGGHEAAAGFTVKTSRIVELSEKMNGIANRVMQADQLQPTVWADAELTMAEVNDGTFDSLNRLAPFGSANPSPLFMARNLRVMDAIPLSDGSHLKLLLADQSNINRAPVEAIVWRAGHMFDTIRQKRRVDLLFGIERRDWKGDVHLQLKVKDIRVV